MSKKPRRNRTFVRRRRRLTPMECGMIAQTLSELTESGITRIANMVESERRMRVPTKVGNPPPALATGGTSETETPVGAEVAIATDAPPAAIAAGTSTTPNTANAAKTAKKKRLKIWQRPIFLGLPEVAVWGQLTPAERSQSKVTSMSISVALAFASRCRAQGIPDRQVNSAVRTSFGQPEFLRNCFSRKVADWTNWSNWPLKRLSDEFDNFVGLSREQIPQFHQFITTLNDPETWSSDNPDSPEGGDADIGGPANGRGASALCPSISLDPVTGEPQRKRSRTGEARSGKHSVDKTQKSGQQYTATYAEAANGQWTNPKVSSNYVHLHRPRDKEGKPKHRKKAGPRSRGNRGRGNRGRGSGGKNHRSVGGGLTAVTSRLTTISESAPKGAANGTPLTGGNSRQTITNAAPGTEGAQQKETSAGSGETPVQSAPDGSEPTDLGSDNTTTNGGSGGD